MPNFFDSIHLLFSLNIMYASRSSAAAASGPSSMGSVAPASADRYKLEARFSLMLTSAGVSNATLDKFGGMGSSRCRCSGTSRQTTPR